MNVPGLVYLKMTELKRIGKQAEDTRSLLLRARTPPRVAVGDSLSPVNIADNQAGEEGSAAKRVALVMRDVGDIGNVILRGRLCLRALKLISLPAGFGYNSADGLDYGRLVHLDLSENGLRDLPPRFGSNLHSLEFLDVSNNCLRAFPRTIGKMRNLRSLYLQNNELRAVPYEIGQCTSLRNLRLENNVFSCIPSSIGKLKFLRCLYIFSLPALSNIPVELGNLSHLQELLMDGTPNLVFLPESLGKLHASGGGSLYVFSCGDLSRFENIPQKWYADLDESYAPLSVLEGLFYSHRLRSKQRAALAFTGVTTVMLMWLRSVADQQLSKRFLSFGMMGQNERNKFISQLGAAGHSFMLGSHFLLALIWNRQSMKRLMKGEVLFAPAINSISLAYLAMETMDRLKRGALTSTFTFSSFGSILSTVYVIYSGSFEPLLNFWNASHIVAFFMNVQALMLQLRSQSHPYFRRNAMFLKGSEGFTKLVHVVLLVRSFSLFSESKWVASLTLAGSTLSVLSGLSQVRKYLPSF
jgi:hypothetical protein